MFSRQTDNRLAASWTPPPTWLFASVLQLSLRLALDRDELVGWLNDLGYPKRNLARGAGEYAVRMTYGTRGSPGSILPC